MCTTAAPACAAATADAAICSGVTAQCGLLVTLVSSPVTAQLIMTSWFMRLSLGRAEWRQAAAGYIIVMIIFTAKDGNCAAPQPPGDACLLRLPARARVTSASPQAPQIRPPPARSHRGA